MKLCHLTLVVGVVFVLLTTGATFIAADGELPAVGSARGVQSKIDELQQTLAERIQQLEHDFARDRIPIYTERNKIIRENLSGFWKRALINHPNFGQIGAQVDYDILQHLVDLSVEEVSSGTASDGTPLEPGHSHTAAGVYKISMSFAPENEYFTDQTIWRIVDTYSIEQHKKPEQVSGVQWRRGKRPTQSRSLFHFFEKHASAQQAHHLEEPPIDQQRLLNTAHMLRYEIFANPFNYYDLPQYEAIAAEAQRRMRVEGSDFSSPASSTGIASAKGNDKTNVDPADIREQQRSEEAKNDNL